MTLTREQFQTIITPIVEEVYGKSSFIDAFIIDLADHILIPHHRIKNLRSREEEIRHTCWNWFSGGDTAASTARKIEAALKGAEEVAVPNRSLLGELAELRLAVETEQKKLALEILDSIHKEIIGL